MIYSILKFVRKSLNKALDWIEVSFFGFAPVSKVPTKITLKVKE